MATDTSPQTLAPPARATGTVVGPWRAMALRLEVQWAWYRRYWRANLYSSGLQPLLFLSAMGLGLGSQVKDASFLGGHTYLQYIAPTLLVSGIVATAVNEAGHPVLSGFKWKQDYIAVVATPITPQQLYGAQLLWIALRLSISAVIYGITAALFGAWTGFGVLLALPLTVFTGAACAAPVMAFAAVTRGEGHAFVALNRFVVLPMTLFAGTYFPVDRLPGPCLPLVWISPIWHGNELVRGVTLGGLSPLPALGHALFLLAMLVAGVLLGHRNFSRRLVV
ncbi:ABC transporter permease [Streptomyces gibsoniae]|uniref:ABC transporter permease n=1 Tax=Streptomyces gibsoniae TaxID=3075529 RepID=A0ABU2U2P2_9ACTN|nr:ABC transporter permease [Streptomyces sp. DSM 41699]MDT0467495.1 ABC transporter permease [Streptomyces sp. DSM 41699]